MSLDNHFTEARAQLWVLSPLGRQFIRNIEDYCTLEATEKGGNTLIFHLLKQI